METTQPDFQLRLATPPDEEFLDRLYQTSRDGEMALAPWPEEQKRDFLLSQGRAQRDSYSKFFPTSTQEIICLGEKPVGRLYLDRTESEIHLMDICLLPEYRNLGIGREILRELIEESERTNLAIWGTVSFFNPGSLRFFQAHGFQVTGENGPNFEIRRVPSSAL